MDMVEKIYINLKICSEYMSENTTILDNSKEIFSYYDVYKVNNNFISAIILFNGFNKVSFIFSINIKP